MQKNRTFNKKIRRLLAVGLGCLYLFSSNSLSADNDFMKLADKFIAQAEQSESKRSKKKRSSYSSSNRQFNNLIDTSRSRSRSTADSQDKSERSKERIEIRVSLDQAVSMVKRSSGGRVIKANTSYSNGRPVHSIRVLSENNRVRTYRIDAVSGRRL